MSKDTALDFTMVIQKNQLYFQFSGIDQYIYLKNTDVRVINQIKRFKQGFKC